MSQIKIEHLHYTYENGFEPVFRDVSLTLDTDWRLGLVGRNGRGKTTLLRLLAGELDSAGAIRAAVRFSYFPFPLPPGAQAQDALSVAREAVAPFAAMERRMEQLLARGDEAALAEYGELEARYAALDGYTIDALLTREAARLGVGEAALSPPLFHPFGRRAGKAAAGGPLSAQKQFFAHRRAHQPPGFAGGGRCWAAIWRASAVFCW